jgi:hypothetical protein
MGRPFFLNLYYEHSNTYINRKGYPLRKGEIPNVPNRDGWPVGFGSTGQFIYNDLWI